MAKQRKATPAPAPVQAVPQSQTLTLLGFAEMLDAAKILQWNRDGRITQEKLTSNGGLGVFRMEMDGSRKRPFSVSIIVTVTPNSQEVK